MISKEKLKEFILKNCVNERGNIEMCDLDFSDFEGDVYIEQWTVNGDIHQSGHISYGSIYQEYQNAVNLFQGRCSVEKSLNQSRCIVGGNLTQNKHRVGGSIIQNHHYCEGIIYQ